MAQGLEPLLNAVWPPLLNTLGLHFATDGYTPVRRGPARDFTLLGLFPERAVFCRRQRGYPP